MDRLREVEADLVAIFRSSSSKHEANVRSRPILEQVSRDPAFLSAVLAKYIATPGALDKKNYPVVGMDIALNPWFGLVANCWIPLPSGSTDLSTKAIHHHGPLLLSTATIFGPGYEHWLFSTPKRLHEGSSTYTMDLLDVGPHPLHHVSFVDKWTAHAPFYPKELSVTLALWSSSAPASWRDRVKRLRFFRGREEQMRKIAIRLGLKKTLDIKTVDSFDFYPESDGFKVIEERKEFELGPNADHVASVFHVIQRTGNEHLVGTVRRALDTGKVTTGRPAVERLAAQLEQGTPIEGKLSANHYDVPRMNFTRDDVERALLALKPSPTATQGDVNGRKFPSAASGEAPVGARSR